MKSGTDRDIWPVHSAISISPGGLHRVQHDELVRRRRQQDGFASFPPPILLNEREWEENLEKCAAQTSMPLFIWRNG
jgi:hypothetical protein